VDEIAGSAEQRGDRIFRWLLTGVGLAILVLLIAIATQLVVGSVDVFKTFGLNFLTNTTWDTGSATYGALPFLAGTVVSAAIAMLVAVPVGILTAIFLSEMAPTWLAVPMTFAVDLIAALPSVIVGLWGLSALSVVTRNFIEVPIVSNFGALPFLGPNQNGLDLMTASFVLALMVTPTIVALTQEVFQTIPQVHREAMLGLGGTRWEVIRKVILPLSWGGIGAAAILALARAIGETMAVAMVIGNVDQVPTGLFDPAQTVASKIAINWQESSVGLEKNSLIALALCLLVLSVAMVLFARRLVRGRTLEALGVSPQ
jgi:phosphate transport system permease protein